MFFHPDPRSGLERLEAKLLEYADDHSKRLGLPIWLDRNGVKEAFQAACSSAQFHRISLEEISHYKELAHIGFWIAELKPLSIQPPPSPEYFFNWVKVASDGAVFGNHATYGPASKSFASASSKFKKYATHPISEYVALEFIANLLEVELLRKVDDMPDPEAQETALRRLSYFKSVLYKKLFPDMVQAMRFHIFTPRSFATLVESVFALEGA